MPSAKSIGGFRHFFTPKASGYGRLLESGQVTRFFVQNFGCRASQADGAAIETSLAAKGMHRAGALRMRNWWF